MQPAKNSYATVADLVASWKALSLDEEARAEVLLLQASNYLRLIAMNNEKDLDDMVEGDPTGVYGANVKMVVMAATQRALAAPSDMVPDATQWSQSATPYSESMSFGSGVSASLYFKDKELKLLGLGNISGSKNIGLMRGIR